MWCISQLYDYSKLNMMNPEIPSWLNSGIIVEFQRRVQLTPYIESLSNKVFKWRVRWVWQRWHMWIIKLSFEVSIKNRLTHIIWRGNCWYFKHE